MHGSSYAVKPYLLASTASSNPAGHWEPMPVDKHGEPTLVTSPELSEHMAIVDAFLRCLPREPTPHTEMGRWVVSFVSKTFRGHPWVAEAALAEWIDGGLGTGWPSLEKLINDATTAPSFSPQEDLWELVAKIAEARKGTRASSAPFSAADLAERALPKRESILVDLIPKGEVTLKYGDGGVGKGLFAIGLGAARASDTDYLGVPTMPGATMFISSEDDDDELHLRINDVVREEDIGFEALERFYLKSMVGEDLVLAAPNARNRLAPTHAFFRLLRTVLERPIRPDLLILENLNDVFGGDQNSALEARQFIRMLQTAAIAFDLTILVLAHPSQQGLASGSGTAGSTAWSNAVRSRLLLERIVGRHGEEPDPNVRRLRVMKSNRARIGHELRLRYHNGVLRREDADARTTENLQAEAADDALFLTLLKTFARDNRNVSCTPGTTYAPAAFAAHPDAGGASKKRFAAAMERLIRRGAVRNATFGPPSKQRNRLEIAA